ncbi:hypothetical protein AB834_04715 [PVC group bacterium (ex Bugula neritina AB1)]|nr:hypothetical protein AB834_04715 [PVC group bacterium (ex Bugula neritina AB1)]
MKKILSYIVMQLFLMTFFVDSSRSLAVQSSLAKSNYKEINADAPRRALETQLSIGSMEKGFSLKGCIFEYTREKDFSSPLLIPKLEPFSRGSKAKNNIVIILLFSIPLVIVTLSILIVLGKIFISPAIISWVPFCLIGIALAIELTLSVIGIVYYKSLFKDRKDNLLQKYFLPAFAFFIVKALTLFIITITFILLLFLKLDVTIFSLSLISMKVFACLCLAFSFIPIFFAIYISRQIYRDSKDNQLDSTAYYKKMNSTDLKSLDLREPTESGIPGNKKVELTDSTQRDSHQSLIETKGVLSPSVAGEIFEEESDEKKVSGSSLPIIQDSQTTNNKDTVLFEGQGEEKSSLTPDLGQAEKVFSKGGPDSIGSTSNLSTTTEEYQSAESESRLETAGEDSEREEKRPDDEGLLGDISKTGAFTERVGSEGDSSSISAGSSQSSVFSDKGEELGLHKEVTQNNLPSDLRVTKNLELGQDTEDFSEDEPDSSGSISNLKVVSEGSLSVESQPSPKTSNFNQEVSDKSSEEEMTDSRSKPDLDPEKEPSSKDKEKRASIPKGEEPSRDVLPYDNLRDLADTSSYCTDEESDNEQDLDPTGAFTERVGSEGDSSSISAGSSQSSVFSDEVKGVDKRQTNIERGSEVFQKERYRFLDKVKRAWDRFRKSSTYKVKQEILKPDGSRFWSSRYKLQKEGFNKEEVSLQRFKSLETLKPDGSRGWSSRYKSQKEGFNKEEVSLQRFKSLKTVLDNSSSSRSQRSS